MSATRDPQTWRVMYMPVASGPKNMAIDEAILASVAEGLQPPTLRFYGWDPACLSLGYGQRSRDADFDALAQRGWQPVRRPTGGRAILHTDELTYAVVSRLDNDRLSGGVLETYRQIAAALVHGLELLATPVITRAVHELPAGANETGPVCFEVPSNWEITVDNKKLVGSAQKRTSRALLQHGTIPLKGDLGRITDVLTYASEAERHGARSSLLAHACTLAQATGRQIGWRDAAEAVAAGFEAKLDITLTLAQLSRAEHDRAALLEEKNYGQERWTHRRP